MKNKKYMAAAVCIVAGAVLGFSYYYFIGCTGGGCPIQSNPVFSTLYGSLLGFAVSSFFHPKDKKNKNENN